MPNYKILVIDYEPRGIKQLREPLVRAGHQVTVAQDGLAGLRVFDEIRPDLTLIEAMLPKKHGFEVCQTLKESEHGRNTPVVIVTSVYKGRKYRTQAIHNYHCDEYLEKPISEEKLLEVVDRLLADRSAASESDEAVESPAPAPVPAPTPQAGASAAAESPGPEPAAPKSDTAEFEIAQRLDELLGD